MTSAAERMSQLIDDLLNFSRLGCAPVSKRPTDLRQLVLDVQREVIAGLDDREIVWHLPDVAISVAADPALLRQALINLLSNAVKYTRGRRPARIDVNVHDDTEQNELKIAVRDNGVGFDRHYAGQLFGVFQRLHDQHEFEGMGIGLANVCRIVHAHGGRVWAEGALDQGATFFVALPRA